MSNKLPTLAREDALTLSLKEARTLYVTGAGVVPGSRDPGAGSIYAWLRLVPFSTLKEN
jgi:hypothetical protein